DADRIRAAAALSEPGVFRLEGPASELFRGFDDLSRNVTRHFYAHECELPLDGARLVPPEQVDAELARQQRAQESSRRWFGSIPVLQISLQVSAQEIRDPGNIPNALGRWRDARRRCDALLPDAHRLGEAVSTAHAAIRSAAAAEWLARGRFTFEAKEFNISSDNVLASPDLEAAAILAQKGHHESLDRLAENLAPALQAMRSRIASALLLAAGSAEPGLAALRQEALPLCDALEALDAVWSRVLSIHESWDAVLVLIQNQGNHSSPGEVAALLESLLARLGEHRDAVIEGLRGVRYPFDHARDELSLADYASDFKPGGSAAETHFNGAGSLLQRLMPFQEQSVSTLVRIVEAIEGAHPLAQGFDPSREATV
ncbi:MAG: hypothetical protein HYR88_12065, partial [Verrucomicrobia bacterium]|nr:hypothetical protein [Verrucomicrobiota bacterium]